MDDPNDQRRSTAEGSNANNWSGFAEVDRAISDNRLTEYQWKKAWADPWNRRAIIAVWIIFAAFGIFVAVSETARG